MEIKEYIASGVVELYVMGSLSESDRDEFERMLSIHPELKKELDVVEESLFVMAVSQSIEPRKEVRSKILNAVLVGSVEKKSDPIVRSMWSDMRIAASITIALLSVGAAFYYHHKWSASEEKFASLVAERDQMAANLNVVNYSFQNALGGIEIMRDLNTKSIALVSTDTSRNFRARVYWNTQSHQSYIDVQQLPDPGPGKQYQLWALVDGKPVDAGVFNLSDSAILQRVKDVQKADLWAVTLEPAGGSVSPTLDKMYLISKS